MSDLNLGLLVIAIFTTIFIATLFYGTALLWAGHVILAILLLCMFGIGLGVSIIEQA